MSEKNYFVFEDGQQVRSATFNVPKGIGENKFCVAVVDVTIVAGTAPTLDIELVFWDEASQRWLSFPTPVTFTQITAAGRQAIEFQSVPNRLRAACVIGGTAPEFTFTLALHTSR